MAHEAPTPGEPVRGDGAPSEVAGTWPCFRGPARDAICTDSPSLVRSWPAEGPPVLWSIKLGEGYAGAAIRDGRAFVLDYDEEAVADTLRCLSLDDGKEIWRNSYPIKLARDHGMSRTVPAIVGQYVITMGPRCQLACWDFETGKCHWLIDLVLEYGTRVPQWYTGQCPLIDQDRLIVAPSGKAMLLAVDYKTGKVIWESPNPRGWRMTHVSVVPMEFAGQQMYVYCGTGGVAGVAAKDGKLLWDSLQWPEKFATSCSPVILPEGKIFLASGYGAKVGSLMLQVKTGGDKMLAEPAFTLKPTEFNAEQHTPIFKDGYLFGIRKSRGRQLVCLDLEGKEIWNSGTDRFGHGPFMFADGLLFILNDKGTLTMAEATPKGYKRLAQHDVLPDGHDAWGPMAIAGGRLIVRDMTRMVCLDLRKE